MHSFILSDFGKNVSHTTVAPYMNYPNGAIFRLVVTGVNRVYNCESVG